MNPSLCTCLHVTVLSATPQNHWSIIKLTPLQCPPHAALVVSFLFVRATGQVKSHRVFFFP